MTEVQETEEGRKTGPRAKLWAFHSRLYFCQLLVTYQQNGRGKTPGHFAESELQSDDNNRVLTGPK